MMDVPKEILEETKDRILKLQRDINFYRTLGHSEEVNERLPLYRRLKLWYEFTTGEPIADE